MDVTRRILLPALIVLMLYTFFIGFGLLFGWVQPDNAYLWIALPCLVPVAWYGYGFMNATGGQQDFGLLLSAAGWALAMLALLIEHGAVASARAESATAAAANANAATPLTAVLCTVFAILFILLGAGVSWLGWQKEISNI